MIRRAVVATTVARVVFTMCSVCQIIVEFFLLFIASIRCRIAWRVGRVVIIAWRIGFGFAKGLTTAIVIVGLGWIVIAMEGTIGCPSYC